MAVTGTNRRVPIWMVASRRERISWYSVHLLIFSMAQASTTVRSGEARLPGALVGSLS